MVIWNSKWRSSGSSVSVSNGYFNIGLRGSSEDERGRESGNYDEPKMTRFDQCARGSVSIH